LVSTLKVVIPISLCSAVVCAVKIFQAENIESPVMTVISNSKATFCYLVFFVLMFIIFMHLTLVYGVNEVINAWNLRDMMQEEIIKVLDNLEEAVITKNENKIGLCNEQGTIIMSCI
jgi:hypothetical protein